MAQYLGRNYPGTAVDKGPEFAEDIKVDRWFKSEGICIDPKQLHGKYVCVFTVRTTGEPWNGSTQTLEKLADVMMDEKSVTNDHYHLVGIDSFAGGSVGIWMDVIQGTPKPGWSELLGITSSTFYNERD
jgi:hypothetical protein